jgi:hypothetical protein
MRDMAVYFLHNKSRSRGYYNLDVRNKNGSQRRVKPKQLPWGMKQVCYTFKTLNSTFNTFKLISS